MFMCFFLWKKNSIFCIFIYKNRYFFWKLLFFVALNFTLIVITFEGKWILMRIFLGITQFSIVYWMRYSAVCNSRASKFRRAFSYFFAFYIVKPLFFSENNYIFFHFFFIHLNNFYINPHNFRRKMNFDALFRGNYWVFYSLSNALFHGV